MVINRFEVYLVNLDPTIGTEIQKTLPCMVISPDEMNDLLSTIIIAPITTKGRDYPSRIPCTFDNKEGQIVLDQLRTVDKKRLIKKLGKVEPKTQQKVNSILLELFAE